MTDPTGNDLPDQAAERGDWLGESLAAGPEPRRRGHVEHARGDPPDPFGETIASELAARLLRRREPLDPFGEQVAVELAARLLRTSEEQRTPTPERPQWEYRVGEWPATGTSSDRGELSDLLADAGAEGWELVATERVGGPVVLIFKRPVVRAS